MYMVIFNIPEILIPRFTISPIKSLVSQQISSSVRPAQGMHCTGNAYGFVSCLSLAIIKINACVAGSRLYQIIAFRVLRDS